MSADTAPAAMPGVEEIGKIIRHAMASLNAPAHIVDRITSHDAAQRILDLFAPILAEKERLERERDEFYRDGLKAEDKWIEMESRALAAEAALAAEREENAALSKKLEIALAGLQHISDMPPRAAATRAQGE